MSSTSSSSATVNAPGFLSLLTLLLVGAKLFAPDTATYSWWVAFAPILLGLAILVVVLGGALALYFADERGKKRLRRERQNRPFR